MSSRKYWIDMTDLSTWRGHFTGTQRVTFEVAKRFSEQVPDEVDFFVYDEKSRNFYQIPFQAILDQVNPQPIPEEAAATPGRHRPSVKNVAKAQSIRLYHNLPFSVKRRITPAHKDFVKKSYSRAQHITKRKLQLRSGIMKVAVQSEPLHFSQTDTIIILGKPWDTMSFIEVLKAQKQVAGFKIVHLIYDMIPIFLPHTFGKPLPENYTKYMFEAIGISDKLIPISKSTERDIVKFCQEELLPVPEMTVTKLGDAFEEVQLDAIKSPLPELASKDFVLCVGTVEIRKNHILLYTAYKEGLKRGLTMPHLVIVGGRGWYTNDVLYEFENDPQIKNLVHFPRNISDEELQWLYRNCKYTVYPSVYEGWGLPIGESLAYGKMCLASHTSSMTEIAGDLIEYFSPYDPVGCLELMEKYSNPKILKKKETEITATYKPVSWDEAYKTVRSVASSLS